MTLKSHQGVKIMSFLKDLNNTKTTTRKLKEKVKAPKV